MTVGITVGDLTLLDRDSVRMKALGNIQVHQPVNADAPVVTVNGLGGFSSRISGQLTSAEDVWTVLSYKGTTQSVVLGESTLEFEVFIVEAEAVASPEGLYTAAFDVIGVEPEPEPEP